MEKEKKDRLLALKEKKKKEKFGSFTDARDGKVYKWVRIGNQVWMAENLNYKISNSYCYDDDNTNCLKYGRLYTWHKSLNVCPSGWHLPSNKEWNFLYKSFGGKTAGIELKSTTGWDNQENGSNGNGSNKSGFSGLPGGSRSKSKSRYGHGPYYDKGYRGYFSSSTKNNSYPSVTALFSLDSDIDYCNPASFGGGNSIIYISVRCIKN